MRSTLRHSVSQGILALTIGLSPACERQDTQDSQVSGMEGNQGSHGLGPQPLNPCLNETRAQPFGINLISLGNTHKITIIHADPLQPLTQYPNSWTLKLETLAGQPVNGASFPVFSPRMPDHGHGLPSEFEVTVVPEPEATQGPGVYRVSNLGFNMGGFWETAVQIQGTNPDGTTWADSLQIKTCINP